MADSDLKRRTKNYALSVIKLFAELPKRTEAQIYRAAVGAIGDRISNPRGRRDSFCEPGLIASIFYPLSLCLYPFLLGFRPQDHGSATC
jgi:hypothetical protein